MLIELTVNGTRRTAENVWAGESLLYMLRERLGLRGSKDACEQESADHVPYTWTATSSARAWCRPARRMAQRW